MSGPGKLNRYMSTTEKRKQEWYPRPGEKCLTTVLLTTMSMLPNRARALSTMRLIAETRSNQYRRNVVTGPARSFLTPFGPYFTYRTTIRQYRRPRPLHWRKPARSRAGGQAAGRERREAGRFPRWRSSQTEAPRIDHRWWPLRVLFFRRIPHSQTTGGDHE